tara:strand:+ start:245 stop:400 length:156 start_codon:yes stop_codon:yes gene_type:complete
MKEHKCFKDRTALEQIQLLSSMKDEDFQKLLELLAIRKVLGTEPNCPKCLI